MSQIIAVSGPRGALADVETIVENAMKSLTQFGEVVEVRTGAQYGIDTLAYWAGLRLFHDAQHTVCVPEGASHNQDLVRHARRNASVIVPVVLPHGAPPGAIYAKRNEVMIEPCDTLLALPLDRVEMLKGSGTWNAIRLARGGKRVVIWPLSERTVQVVPSEGERGMRDEHAAARRWP